MELAFIDWAIIVAFLLLSLFIGIRYKNKASGSLTDFFLGGRNLPWYIAGISMVATTFAADTPLAVTEMVAQNGISKNWLWWSFLIGGLLTTFFFAKLWRKANILTEPEFIEFRYSESASAVFKRFQGGVFRHLHELLGDCLGEPRFNVAFDRIFRPLELHGFTLHRCLYGARCSLFFALRVARSGHH